MIKYNHDKIRNKRLENGFGATEVGRIAMRKYGVRLTNFQLHRMEEKGKQMDCRSVNLFVLSLIYECAMSDFYDVQIEKDYGK